jgi:ASC-1-like (ASCH) protein
LNSPWFEYVKDGTTIYEGGSNKGIATEYKSGDILNVKHYIDPLKYDGYRIKIIDILKFDTFEYALNKIDIGNLLLNIYKKYVSIETQNKYGVLLIKIMRI